jgi:sulfur carrier protein
MRVILNGKPRETEAVTLASLLAEFLQAIGAPPDARVATALNGEFAPKGLRAGLKLNDGDQIEIVAPMQGG